MSCCNETAQATAQDSGAKLLDLEFLFLDESVCKPCGGTGQALDAAVEITAAPLQAMGVALRVKRIHLATREDALAHRVPASPTIRIDGEDIAPGLTEDECESCGDLAGGQTPISCRTWAWKGEFHGSAPVGLIVAAIMRAALARSGDAGACCADRREEQGFELPRNLETFFEARQGRKTTCC